MERQLARIVGSHWLQVMLHSGRILAVWKNTARFIEIIDYAAYTCSIL
jgi:hypothetical protein